MIPAVLAALALLLAGCSASSAGASPETAESAALTWDLSGLRELSLQCEDGYYLTDHVAFQDSDAYGGMLIGKYDYDTGEWAPVCRVPGCTHSGETCLAWSMTDSVQLAALDGDLLLIHSALDTETRQMMLDYYNEILADPDRLAAYSVGGASEAYLRALAEVTAQPSWIDRISADGTRRERLITLPDGVPISFSCRDNEALYGLCTDNGSLYNRGVCGIRVTLDGQYTTFPLPEPDYTTLQGAIEGRLLLMHTSFPLDISGLNVMTRNWYYMMLDRGTDSTFWLYDPVSGENEPVDFADMADEGDARMLTARGGCIVYTCQQGRTLAVYDIARGESRVLGTSDTGVFWADVICDPDGRATYLYTQLDDQGTVVDLRDGVRLQPPEDGWQKYALVADTGRGTLLASWYDREGTQYGQLPIRREETLAELSAQG